MSQQGGSQRQTVEDALARRVEYGKGVASGWAEALRELGMVDQAVYQAVAETPTPELDGHFRRLSNAANYSRLWFGIAAVIAMLGGRRGRRVALSDGEPRHQAPFRQAATGARSPGVRVSFCEDAGICIVPLRPCRIGVRLRIYRGPASAGVGRADSAARRRGCLLASPHRCALSRRCRLRLHHRSRHCRHCGSGERPDVPNPPVKCLVSS
jgi:hypothetical protein